MKKSISRAENGLFSDYSVAVGPKLIALVILIAFLCMSVYSYTLNSTDTLKELESILVDPQGKVLPENEGKLVIVSGKPEPQEQKTLFDDDFGVSVDGAYCLDREIFQKRYHIEEEKEEYVTFDKDKNREVSYTYTKNLVSSWDPIGGDFEDKVYYKGDYYYNEPRPDITCKNSYNPINIGEFEFNIHSFGSIVNYETIYPEVSDISGGYLDSIGEYHVAERSNGGGYFSTGDSIGDIHVMISAHVYDDEFPVITRIGMQKDNRIVAYDNFRLTGIDEIIEGELTREEYLAGYSESMSKNRTLNIVFICIWCAGIVFFTIRLIKSIKKRKAELEIQRAEREEIHRRYEEIQRRQQNRK
ncbi:MAG: hypothetical protein Q4C42_03745, partial [Clostridia bacterium]|nr:hypothetical protein [Clostridia bacterium]